MNLERCRSVGWTSILAILVAMSGRANVVSAMPPVFDPDGPVIAEPAPVKIAPIIGSGPVQDPPTPVVCIGVRVPASALPGEELEYRICVENQSFAAAHHVIVRNPLPAHAKYVRAKPAPSSPPGTEIVWELGTLEACGKREILLVLSPTGTGDVKNCARVQFEHGQCVCTKVPKAIIGIRKSGPSKAIPNETLTYRLTVTNTGEVDARDVNVTDALPAGLEHASGKKQLLWSIGTLAAGQSRTIEYEVVAKELGKHCNQAVVVAEGGLHEEIESCVTVVDAKLSVSKLGPTKRYVNLPATYEFTVKNEGTVALGNVTLTDPVPEGLSFVNATHDGALTENRVHWSLGGLEPGESRTVQVVFRAKGAVKACNRVTVTADHGLSAQAEICTEFVGVSALLLEVVDTEDPVEVGGETSYLIIVRNQGSLPATNVAISALVPDHEQVIKVTGPATHKQVGQSIASLPFTIPPQGEARFTIVVRARRAGDVRFKVDLTSDILTAGPVHEEESTTLYAEPPQR